MGQMVLFLAGLTTTGWFHIATVKSLVVQFLIEFDLGRLSHTHASLLAHWEEWALRVYFLGALTLQLLVVGVDFHHVVVDTFKKTTLKDVQILEVLRHSKDIVTKLVNLILFFIDLGEVLLFFEVLVRHLYYLLRHGLVILECLVTVGQIVEIKGFSSLL